jgi:hypothetical protein
VLGALPLLGAVGYLLWRQRAPRPGQRASRRGKTPPPPPVDLTPTDVPTGIPAVIETIEYRGREYHGLAKTSGGLEVFFSSPTALPVGGAIRLGAEADRVLVYPEDKP